MQVKILRLQQCRDAKKPIRGPMDLLVCVCCNWGFKEPLKLDLGKEQCPNCKVPLYKTITLANDPYKS